MKILKLSDYIPNPYDESSAISTNFSHQPRVVFCRQITESELCAKKERSFFWRTNFQARNCKIEQYRTQECINIQIKYAFSVLSKHKKVFPM